MCITHRLFFVSAILLYIFTGAYSANDHCEVIKYVTYCAIRNDKLYTTDSVVIQVNDRTGESYTHISLDYNRNNPITSLTAWIEDGNGKVIRYLKNKEITNANSVTTSFYTDEFTRSFFLKHSEYPYRIGYTYEKTYKEFLTIAFWYPIVSPDVPTRYAKLVLSHPESYKVNILQNQVTPPVISSESGMLTHTWISTYDGTFEKQIYSPEPLHFLPNVRIIPVHFSYGLAGSMDSWQSFGDWQYGLINGLDELPENDKRYINSQILNISDRRDMIRALYHYLQDHTRYVDVFIEIGGLKPYPAAYVAQNRYGDCKALTIYMKAMLKHAGIESYYTLVHSGLQPVEINKNAPSQQFNHVILAVPVENDTLWLENTSNCNPFGYAGVNIQGRPGLLVDKDRSRMVSIPSLTPQDVHQSCKMDYTLHSEGGATVTARYNHKGYLFEWYNELISEYNPEVQNEYVHERLPFPSFELLEWKILKNGRDARSLELTALLKIDQLARSIGQQYYFSYQPVNLPDFELPSDRRLPVQIPYPVYQSDTLVYHLPAGRSVVTLPAGKTIESKFGKYVIAFRNDGNAITLYREFQLNAGTIPQDEYTSFYQFLLSIRSEEKQKILFQ